MRILEWIGCNLSLQVPSTLLSALLYGLPPTPEQQQRFLLDWSSIIIDRTVIVLIYHRYFLHREENVFMKKESVHIKYITLTLHVLYFIQFYGGLEKTVP